MVFHVRRQRSDYDIMPSGHNLSDSTLEKFLSYRVLIRSIRFRLGQRNTKLIKCNYDRHRMLVITKCLCWASVPHKVGFHIRFILFTFYLFWLVAVTDAQQHVGTEDIRDASKQTNRNHLNANRIRILSEALHAYVCLDFGLYFTER